MLPKCVPANLMRDVRYLKRDQVIKSKPLCTPLEMLIFKFSSSTKFLSSKAQLSLLAFLPTITLV